MWRAKKAADAAAVVFPDCVVTTWARGADAWPETDWEPLAGREVLLVADADKSGRDCMEAIADTLAGLKCTVCAHLPGGNDKDDIADWHENDGVEATRERIEAEARVWEPATTTAADAGATETDEEAIARLAALPELEYEQVRKAEAKRLDIRTAVLDKLVRHERSGNEGDHLQGRPIEWNEPEPWPELADGEALLTYVTELIRRYVDLPDAKADAVTLWIVHTFLHRRLDLSTILILKSATKRCGKTLLMEIAGSHGGRSPCLGGKRRRQCSASSHCTSPPCFWMKLTPTWARTLNCGASSMALNSRGSASTIRNVGEDHEPRRFSTWCPKAISGIGNLPDTVADRAVTVRLERRSPTAGDMPHWRDRDRQAVEVLKQKLARWTDDSVDAVLERRNAVAFPSGLNDRACDAWEALLAIAEVAGGEWAGTAGRAYRACEAINAEVDPETGASEMLLTDLWAVYKEAGDPEHLPTGKRDDQYDPNEPAILPALIAMEGRPWSEWSRGRPLSPRGLANLLKGFGIAPGTIRPEPQADGEGLQARKL